MNHIFSNSGVLKAKKLCVITGASSGIGFETLKVFYVNNWRCVAISIDKSKQKGLFRDMPEVIPVVCDISDKEAIKASFNKIYEMNGNIDCLVNSAGVGLVRGINDIEFEELDSVLRINLEGTVMCIKEVLPYMKEGSIVNICSKAGKKGSKNSLAYCASKFGLIGLSESIALDLVNTNVRLFVINPGLTNTPMSQTLFPKSALKAIPATEVADTIFFAAEKLHHVRYACIDIYGIMDLKG